MVAVLAVILSAGCSLYFFTSCNENKNADPAEAPKKAFLEAMDYFISKDYDTYSQHLDYGVDMDSTQHTTMLSVLRQHQEWQETSKGSIDSCIAVGATLECDTVATVYYKLKFAGGTSEVSSQKMVRINGEWKIRVRN